MNFLFKLKTKTPADLVKVLNEQTSKLALSESKTKAEIEKCTSSMLSILQDSNLDKKKIYTTDVLVKLIPKLYKIKFESRKEISLIYCILIKRKVGNREPTVEYLTKRPSILKDIIKGYAYNESAIFCGAMLRESIKHESLLDIVLDSPEFYLFFEYVEADNFDIASDAFANFRDALIRFKPRVCKFLIDEYEKFFSYYDKLLVSKNYVIKRQSLKLLGEILLERKNFNVMTKYINNSDNLVMIMKSLADKSKSIQYEAFHIFKIFVANPNKTAAVYTILKNNKSKLISFLMNFQTDKDSDEQFRDEKAFLVKELKKVDDSG
ncbi:hypothetical protein BB561_005284 [Smittium simulii]|uniref:Calcium-binding protein 39 n=1 Tax=Smittium simulii TaxID=133385 RepID=A0A2T9YB82_9FUNG|nr:hypothetical protein BB561_005284 [Smittium simulii]